MHAHRTLGAHASINRGLAERPFLRKFPSFFLEAPRAKGNFKTVEKFKEF